MKYWIFSVQWWKMTITFESVLLSFTSLLKKLWNLPMRWIIKWPPHFQSNHCYLTIKMLCRYKKNSRMLSGSFLQHHFQAKILHYQLTMFLSPLRKKGMRIQLVWLETRCLYLADSTLHPKAEIYRLNILAYSNCHQILTETQISVFHFIYGIK